MDSNSRYQLQQQHHQKQQQQHQPNSGLLRFRSAPGSILTNLTQGGNKGTSTTTTIPWGGSSSSSSEPERLASRFLNSSDNNNNSSNNDASPSLRELQDKPCFDNNNNNNKDSSSLSLMNNSHHHHHHHQQGGYVPSRFMREGSSNASPSSMDCSFGLMDLQRQSSFPAPTAHFSSNISFRNNGYDTMKGVGNYDGVNGSDSELSLSINRVNNQISFSPSSSRDPSSSLGILSRMGSDGGSNNNGFNYGSWNNNNETLHLSEKINGSNKRENGEHGISHQLSFSKASSDIFAMENMIHFPSDSVPCKIRAKRGCATHPRSIAERVRRTRISERMRKLQELVPNMDKQTSTAEMLDLAVVYIKDLQKQFKKLSEKRAKCKCTSMHNSDPNQTA